MKKIAFTLFLTFSALFSIKAQNNSVSEFYSFLNNILENNKNHTIELLMTNYGCLGSQIHSEAKLIKRKNKIEIQYFDLNSKNLIEKKLDTTFIVSRKKFTQNLKNEINLFDSRVVYLEATYKIIVNTDKSKNEFMLKKADGLYYLLRFNRSYEANYKNWLKREIQ